MKDELLRLADLCEKATAQDWELNATIASGLGWVKYDNPTHAGGLIDMWASPEGVSKRWHLPNYTGSIDAAMTLVEPTWHCGMGRDGNLHNPTRSWAWVRYQFEGAWCETENVWVLGEPALALCAAALRARAFLGDAKCPKISHKS